MTRDSVNIGNILLIKFSPNGEVVWKRLFDRAEGGAIVIAKNGDFLIGGNRINAPYILRTDSSGTVKWYHWYYDSTKGLNGSYLTGQGIINSILETSNG